MEKCDKLCFLCDRFKGFNVSASMTSNNDSNISNSKPQQSPCTEEFFCKELIICGTCSEYVDKTHPDLLAEVQQMKKYGYYDFKSGDSVGEHWTIEKENIAQLKLRIEFMKDERKAIEDSSFKLKMEIHDQMSGKMSLLRKREFQLYRQVDALYNYQNSLLQEYLSKLHSVLGSYQANNTTLRYRNGFKLADNEADKEIFMDSSPTYEEVMKGFPKQNLQFVADDMNLKSLIKSYGRVEVSGGHTGMFLLPDEEEYEDGNHVFLSKSINPEREQSPGKVNPSFEVHNKNQSSTLSSTSSDVNFLKGAQFVFPDIKDLTSPFKKTSVDSPCSTDSFEVIMSDAREVTELKENNIFYTCDYSADKDIESLSELSCASGRSTKNSIVVSEWLRKNEASDRNSLGKVSSAVPHVKRLCKANKKCSSYSACICKVNCLVSHLKEQLERLRSSDTSLFSRPQLNHTINQVIQSETQKNESITNNSTYSGSLKDEKMEVAMQMPHSLNWDAKNWLTPKKNARPIPAECETWLATASSIEDQPDAADLVKGLFAPYFGNKNMNQWLNAPPGKYLSHCC